MKTDTMWRLLCDYLVDKGKAMRRVYKKRQKTEIPMTRQEVEDVINRIHHTMDFIIEQ